MRDLKNAALMLALAKEDLQAAEGMRLPANFSDRIFGFHAQQAAEKALKAWLSLLGVDYPSTHDLLALFSWLADTGEMVPGPFRELEFLTIFAVQFRYGIVQELDSELDRSAVLQQVKELIEYVAQLVAQEGPASPR